jgi:predicted nuclease with TOPRIM domain
LEEKKKELKEKLDELIKESKDLMNFIRECECEYKGFTIDDFDFDEQITAKRNEKISTEMEIEIAQNKAQAKK